MQTPISNPETISRFKKERFLLSMTEDEFRDRVVRPLFLRQGLLDGRDMCGPNEKGKDAIFISVDALGMENIYVIQTKKGSLTMSRRVGDNVVEATTQLKTAVTTSILLIAEHKKVFPTKVILCSSGKINENARQHIFEEVRDPRIGFLDSDDLTQSIDKHFPELWLGIDADLFPYFRAIKKLVESPADGSLVADVLPSGTVLDAATDGMFVPLRLHRLGFKIQRRHGHVFQTPFFENFPAIGIINRKERLVLVIGDAGSGKSTTIKRIAYILADKGMSTEAKSKIPILLRATEIWARK